MDICRLTDTLIRHEGTQKRGERHIPYKDSVGKLTIGFGRNLSDRGISTTEARQLLNNDIQESINDLRNRYLWFDDLGAVRQEVIINMVFNLGIGGFSKFKRTIKHISEGRYLQASREMLDSKWAKQVGNRANELSNMMASGIVHER